MPIYEWYVVRCGSKNGHQNDMCLKEIGLHAQNMLTILGSMGEDVNTIGWRPILPLSEHENLHSDDD